MSLTYLSALLVTVLVFTLGQSSCEAFFLPSNTRFGFSNCPKQFKTSNYHPHLDLGSGHKRHFDGLQAQSESRSEKIYNFSSSTSSQGDETTTTTTSTGSRQQQRQQHHHDNASSSDDGHHHGKYERAVHQLEHRAKEKTAIGAAEKVVERLSEQALDRVGERSAEHFVERASEKAIQKGIGEKIFGKFAKKSAVSSAERVGERTAERITDQSSKRIAERVGERAFDNMGERSAERLGTNIGRGTAERVGESATKLLLEESGERIIENAGNRVADRMIDQIGEKATGLQARRKAWLFQKPAEELSERVAERALAQRGSEHLVDQAGIRSGEEGMIRLVERGGDRISVRISKGVMIALPAIGGLFAMYLLKADIERCKEEASKNIKSALAFFVGAGLADFIDTIVHFILVYGLSVHLSHHKLAIVEKVSMGCAVLSTVCAVVGEVISFKIRKRNERMQQVA